MEESELIDRYLKGELDEDQLMAFVSRLQADSAFNSQFELRKLLIDSINEAYKDELKEKLKNLDKRLDKKTISIFNPIMIAASITFFIVTSAGLYLYFNRKPNLSNYDLYESGTPNVMGHSDKIEISNAMNLFKANEYESASEAFSRLPQNDTVLYYSGICSFRLGLTEKAIKILQQIKPESEYYNKAKYRIGLSLWNKNEIDKAIPFFMDVAKDTSNEYGKNAKRILIKEF